MAKALIIVESPAKIKTLQKFLGRKFTFAASLGHIRDLPEKGFGIDVEHDFEPQYQVLAKKKEVVKKLKEAAKEVDTVYLAPDPDREGEAIAWHIAQLLPSGITIKRATFHAITKEAVLESIEHPKEIDLSLVNAQQARRLLDRIVGYKISPILARKLQRRSGVSAGRVQSVALKLVVDREKEIEKFKPVEYWNLGAFLKTHAESKAFLARLVTIDGKKVEKEKIPGKNVALVPNKETADKIVEKLKKASYTTGKIDRKEKKRNPEPPFITSTLQQEASRHFRFSAARTMSIAQSLYEGVDMEQEGREGLITYMRTDSVRLSPEALSAARKWIGDTYGAAYLPEQPRYYTKRKTAQDAHEAIRPTQLTPPDKVKKFLTKEQYQLYTLIWQRYIASQMNPAIYDTVSCEIETNQGLELRATGSQLKFDGFLALYEERADEEGKEEDENALLPHLEEGARLLFDKVTSEQAFTKPPARFTEASLVKELEKSGIGRPSTYAPIMNKIQSREYTVKENQRLKPTELGMVIAEFLETNFTKIMDVGFTASMEDTLESIAADKKAWKEVIKEFWEEFIPVVDKAAKEAVLPKIPTDLICPKCGSQLVKIFSRQGFFYGCSTYPECDFTSSPEALTFKKEDYAEDFDWEQKCPICQSEMKLRFGKFGPFLGCTRYPKCKGIVNIPKKGEIAPQPLAPCPAIGCDGKILARKSRFGKTFFSCSNFPDCDVIVNDIEELEKKYANHPKTAYVKKSGGGKGRKQGKLTPTPELAAIVGSEPLTRGEAIKRIWEYIKLHERQDPLDKRRIIPDKPLAALFGKEESVSMFELSGIIGRHLK